MFQPRKRWQAAAVALACALAAFATGGADAADPPPGPRIDLKVLVLAATGDEPSFGAWQAALRREGVPFDALVADDQPPLTDATFADYTANRARYQGVILATGDLLHPVPNPDGSTSWLSALADGEWAALERFERTFGIRRISDATFPTPVHGLNTPAAPGTDLGGTTGTLTTEGREVFPYLAGPVPVAEGSYGYLTTPALPPPTPTTPAGLPTFTTLVQGPGGSALAGVHRLADGREELVLTVDGNQYQTQNQLLRHGLVEWVTRGVHLGHQRNWFAMHVDDVFLPDDRWDMDLNLTAVDGPTTAPDEIQCDDDPATAHPDCRPIRMVPADVDRALAWQAAGGIVLDMAFNGHGSDEAVAAAGADPLTDAFVQHRSSFRWINHTYTHPNLDAAPLATLRSEIGTNKTWGLAHGLALDTRELVTGEHSGLHNPFMPAALAAEQIEWVGSDNSREPQPYALGPATTVPRFPSNVYYNVGTREEQLDEYNHIYLPPELGGRCVDTATNTCRTTPATWEEYVDSEASIMFGHLMGNDPRPHYAHQSNLAEDGVLYDVMDAVLDRYRAWFLPPLVQPTMQESSKELARQTAWQQNVAAGKVTAYLRDGQVHIDVTETMEVPLSGTSIGDQYGGTRSGWTTVTPKQPTQAPARPSGAAGALTPAGSSPGGPATGPRPQGRDPGRPGGSSSSSRSTQRRLLLRRLRMTPRRFALAHRTRRARRRPDGATVTWTLNARATVRFEVQSRRRKRWVRVGVITRRARAGASSLRFTGRVRGRRLRPGRHRLVVSARAPGWRPAARRHLSFTVKEG
jgi:hypothetical protein